MSNKLPLEGVKVLDFSRLLPGPFAVMMLGDFGADIIRVEEMAGGTRPTGRRLEQSKGAVIRNVLTSEPPEKVRPYEATGRNKRSIVLNLKDGRGQDIAMKLAQRSDVLLEEFRPGVMKRLGIDYDTVRKANPGIIYCSMSLYGQTGPYSVHPGHDPCALGVAGLLCTGADIGGPPRLVGAPVGDIGGSLHAVIGILLALRAREKTGKGQYIDVSIMDAAIDYQALAAQTLFVGKRPARPQTPNPSVGLWKCKDGRWLCTTNGEAHHWANFCRSIGREDIIPFQWDKSRRKELHDLVQEIFLTKTAAEWLDIFWGENESQASPVLPIEEVFDDPQVRARNMVLELDHPRAGKVRQPGISIKLSDTPGRVRSFAPMPGEHTRQILSELGYSRSDSESLFSDGACE